MTTNTQRAGWARNALATFTSEVGRNDIATDIADLIGDLMHLAKKKRLDPVKIIERAVGMWSAEDRAIDDEPMANDLCDITITPFQD